MDFFLWVKISYLKKKFIYLGFELVNRYLFKELKIYYYMDIIHDNEPIGTIKSHLKIMIYVGVTK